MLGVDPGTARTGYGVVERPEAGPYRLVECGVIRPPAKADLARKLDAIFTELEALITRLWPETIGPGDLGNPYLWEQAWSARRLLLAELGL